MQQLKLTFLTLISTTLFFVSCAKEDSSGSNSSSNTTTLPAGPQDTVTSFMVYFTDAVDSVTEVGSYDDPDGPGPKAASVGGVVLKKNSTYFVSFFIEDATSTPKNYLHNKIKSNGKEYKFCFGNPLGINVVATDSDGSFPIGLNSTLTTSSTTGSGQLGFTIKYQKGVKNGSCSPGVVYHTCNIPIFVN